MVETEEDIVMEIAGEEEEKHGGKFAVITRPYRILQRPTCY